LSVGEDEGGKEGEAGNAKALSMQPDAATRRRSQLRRYECVGCALAVRLEMGLVAKAQAVDEHPGRDRRPSRRFVENV
jgi:hypothetical protein